MIYNLYLEHLGLAVRLLRNAHIHQHVQPAWTHESGIQQVRPVGGANHKQQPAAAASAAAAATVAVAVGTGGWSS